MDALYEFDRLDAQHSYALADQDAAYTANDIANAVAAELLLDAPETSRVMNAVYRVLIAQATAPPSLDSIPW